MVPHLNFHLPTGFSYLPLPTDPRNPTLAIEAPLTEENTIKYDQITGVEHGLSDIRENMKILWQKSKEREDAQKNIQNIWNSKSNINGEYKTVNSRAMEAHTQMLSTLKIKNF